MYMNLIFIKKIILKFGAEEVPCKGVWNIHSLFHDISQTPSEHGLSDSKWFWFDHEGFFESFNVSQPPNVTSKSDGYTGLDLGMISDSAMWVLKVNR